MQRPRLFSTLATAGLASLFLAVGLLAPPPGTASSHREAPMISEDPLADNTDLYAFREPIRAGGTDNVIIVANYIPLELPSGGPNYHQFGENIRYEIHVKNQTSAGALGTATDDITYRFTFSRTNENPNTFFPILLGDENLNTSYTMEKSTDGGMSFQTVITNGPTPPPNVGPRSINSPLGLNDRYRRLTRSAITRASSGETVFVGPRDDPFFVDLGGTFDVGNIRTEFCEDESNPNCARDEVAGFNTHAIVIRVPVQSLQKDGKDPSQATSILDGDFTIGVWASASRPQVTTLNGDGTRSFSGDWIQVSRLGNPLINEVIIPIGRKDEWNATSPYDALEQDYAQYFVNPELANYMGNGAAPVPPLGDAFQVQTNAYPALNLDGDGNPSNQGSGLDFTNGADGAFAVFPLIASGDLDIDGTAFAVPTRPTQPGVPTALIGEGEPRRLDVLPILYFGVPNAAPYQLATGKPGLVADTDDDGALEFTQGKPFINNFLPITATPDGGLWGGDMLRLNMAVPATDRSSEEFRSWAYQGLIRAAAIGLTSPDFASTDLEFIPHMDGFPNGRRLQDDVTGIELQAVGGLVLAAVGVPFDDATAPDYSDLLSEDLLSALTFVPGPTQNDLPFFGGFPYLANPHRGFDYVRDVTAAPPPSSEEDLARAFAGKQGLGLPDAFLMDDSFPNPTAGTATIRYHLRTEAPVRIDVYDVQGRLVQTLVNGQQGVGTHTAEWDTSALASGTYVYRMTVDGEPIATKRATLVR
ncbi:MAG: DUF4331 family protein [Bacteroidota bacterium]